MSRSGVRIPVPAPREALRRVARVSGRRGEKSEDPSNPRPGSARSVEMARARQPARGAVVTRPSDVLQERRCGAVAGREDLVPLP
jgi:hypothetical protein